MTEHTNQDSKKSLMEEIGITDREIAKRRAFLEISDEDIRELLSIDPIAQEYADPVINAFYKHLLAFEETRVFFQDPVLLERVKRSQKLYFAKLTRGNYDKTYIEDRLKIGAVHERIGLPVKAYLGMYNFYLRNVANRIFEAYKDEPGKALRSYLSLLKVVFLDIGLAIDTYINRREQLIGVDLSHVKTTVDLQSGLEEAERLLGYRLVPLGEKTRSDPANL